jgi:EmrB/QacA subfamily drug resistance transporter
VADGIAPGRHKWLVLSAVSIGTFMATLDSSIVNISLPRIQQAFDVRLASVEWVVVAYLLAVGTLLLPFGRAGEIAGFKRVYLTGFTCFTVASALCGAAPGIRWLIGFRVLQGVGAAMLQAMGPAIISRTFGPRERGKALGLNGVSVSVGLSLGPTLGGVLTEWASWRWIFYINVPVGIFAILWAWRVLMAQRGSDEQRFDPLGATLSFGTMFALLLALVEGETWGWASAPVIGLLVASLGFGLAFVVVELRAAHPMLDLGLFSIRAFTLGNLSLLIAFAALIMTTFLMPFFLLQGQGLPASTAGLLLTPVPLISMVVAPLSGAWSDRIGSRLPATLGLGLTALAVASLTQVGLESSPAQLVWRLLVLGIGQGLFMSPNSSAVLGSVPRNRLGTASAMLAQMRIEGQVLGIAAAGAIVAVRLASHSTRLSGLLSPGLVHREALVASIHDAFWVGAAVCVVGVVTSAVRGRPPAGS